MRHDHTPDLRTNRQKGRSAANCEPPRPDVIGITKGSLVAGAYARARKIEKTLAASPPSIAASAPSNFNPTLSSVRPRTSPQQADAATKRAADCLG